MLESYGVLEMTYVHKLGEIKSVNTWCDKCNKRTKSLFFGDRFVCTECETETNYGDEHN